MADVSAIQRALSDIQSIVTQIIQVSGGSGTLSSWQKAEESMSIIMAAGGLAVDVAASIPEAAALIADPVGMAAVVQQCVAMVQSIIAAAAAVKPAVPAAPVPAAPAHK